MYHRTLLVLALSSAGISQASSLVRRDCSAFRLVGDERGYESQYPAPFRTSETLDCTGIASPPTDSNSTEEGCSTAADAYVTVHPRINITDVSNADVERVLDLVSATVGCSRGYDFNNTIVTHVTGLTNGVRAGQMGYLAFVPYMQCWEGILSDCDDGPIANDTPVEACAIRLFNTAEVNGTRDVRGYNYVIFTDDPRREGYGSEPPEQLSSSRPCGEGVSVDDEESTAEIEDAAVGLRESLSAGFMWTAGLGWLVIALVS